MTRLGRSSIIFIIILSSICFTKGQLLCLNCLAGDEVDYCNTTATSKRCSTTTEMCSSKVTNENGELYNEKTCIEADDCLKSIANNGNECQIGVVLSSCLYCCQEDSCNYDQFEYSTTLPPSTTPHSTTITTTTSPTAAFDCVKKSRVSCVAMGGKNIAEPFTTIKSLLTYCKKLNIVYECLAEKSEKSHCTSDPKELYAALNKHLVNLTGECPGKCKQDEARTCIESGLQEILTSLIMGTASCDIMKSKILKVRACAMPHNAKCGEDIRAGFETYFYALDSAIIAYCARPAEDHRRSKRQAGSCEPGKAVICLTKLSEFLLDQTDCCDNDPKYIDLKKDTDACLKNKISEASCTQAMKERVTDAYELIMKFKLGCGEKPDLKCDTDAARKAQKSVFKLIQGGNFGKACLKIVDLAVEIQESLRGCDDTERESYNNDNSALIKQYEKLRGKCGTRAQFSTSCSDLQLTEGGEEKNVKIKSFHKYDSEKMCGNEADCKIFYVLDFKNGKNQIACRPEKLPTTKWPCAVEITSDNWDKIHKIYLAATLDGIADGNPKVEMSLVFKKVVKGEVKDSQTQESCTITVQDRQMGSRCGSINDPHMSTFDRVYYDNFFTGEFVLYKHKTLPYEVQTLYTKCGGVATCNSGVAVRSGNFVLTTTHNSVQYFSPDGTVPPGTSIVGSAGSFTIRLPHGTTIYISRGGTFLNIYVAPSAFDYKNTEGLCGFFDGKSARDLILPNGQPYTGGDVGPGRRANGFCMAWKVQAGQSLFSGVRDKVQLEEKKYCRCENAACGKIDCSVNNIHAKPFLVGEISPDKIPFQKPVKDSKRKRRGFAAIPDSAPSANFSDPGRKWSADRALQYCKGLFDDSSVASQCRDLAETDVEGYVNMCLQDVELTDGNEFALTAMDSMKLDCNFEMASIPFYTENAVAAQVSKEIVANICELDCSGNGECIQGVCKCKDGYVDEICSVKSDAVPQDVKGDNDGMCDSRNADCSVIVVFASDIIDSENLTCHLQTVEGNEPGDQFTVKGDFLGFNQLICRLSNVDKFAAYQVAISNDGFRPDPQSFYYQSYDSECHGCQRNGNVTTCIRKEKNCFIDGRCYLHGESVGDDKCTVCDETLSKTAASQGKDIACLHKTTIVGMIFVCLISCFIIITLGVCIYKYQKKHSGSSGKIQEKEPSELTSLNPN